MEQTILIGEIEAAYVLLLSAEKDLADKKCEILIRSLNEFGFNKALVSKLKKKGLPKCIIVSAGIDKQVISHLSFFAQVMQRSILPDHTIMFSWEPNFQVNQSFPYYSVTNEGI